MTQEIRRRPDLKYEVTEGGEWVAGPFDTYDEASKWASDHKLRPRLSLPEDIRRVAHSVEAAYLQRVAKEDLAYLIGTAVAEERRRCLELTLSMKNQIVDVGNGLMRRPGFEDLAAKIRQGRDT